MAPRKTGFKTHGWNVVGTEKGEEWGPLMEAYAQLARPAKGVEVLQLLSGRAPEKAAVT